MDSELLKRELRVAFSPRAQPIYFRIAKYVLLFYLVRRYYGTRHFWLWVGGACAGGTALHFLYRFKTRCWTEAWGGWDDLQATDTHTPQTAP
jgi:hypothetical protein